MQRVDYAGMTDECFTKMTKQRLLALNNFSSHGSGWSIHQIINTGIRLMKVKPIRASSYLALPTELARSRFLLNIRNQQNERWFLHCFTAQNHNLFGPFLTTSHDSWRQRSNPNLYDASNPSVKQPKGEFAMPMGLNKINRFEDLNNVCVNVFSEFLFHI